MNLSFPDHYGQLSRSLPNWKMLVDKLAEPVHTSGQVQKVTGVTRKVLHDWAKSDILYTFHRGGPIPRKESEEEGWKLYSVYDMWTLAIFKNLRDWGAWLEKLRPKKGKPAPAAGCLYGRSVPEMLYKATCYWVYRIPVYLSFGEDFVGINTAERVKKGGQGWGDWKFEFYDDPRQKQFYVVSLLPLMDNVASTLSRPDFEMFYTPLDVLADRFQQAHKSVLPEMWDIHVQFRVDGKPLELEPLHEVDR